MLLTGRDSIRDVIAFPKAASGHDPLTGAPTPITAAAAQGSRHRRHARSARSRVSRPRAAGALRRRAGLALVSGRVQARVHSAVARGVPRRVSWRNRMLCLIWPWGVSAMWERCR